MRVQTAGCDERTGFTLNLCTDCCICDTISFGSTLVLWLRNRKTKRTVLEDACLPCGMWLEKSQTPVKLLRLKMFALSRRLTRRFSQGFNLLPAAAFKKGQCGQRNFHWMVRKITIANLSWNFAKQASLGQRIMQNQHFLQKFLQFWHIILESFSWRHDHFVSLCLKCVFGRLLLYCLTLPNCRFCGIYSAFHWRFWMHSPSTVALRFAHLSSQSEVSKIRRLYSTGASHTLLGLFSLQCKALISVIMHLLPSLPLTWELFLFSSDVEDLNGSRVEW